METRSNECFHEPSRSRQRTSAEHSVRLALISGLEQMDRDGVNQLPVMTDGRMVGMLSREDVITFLRTLEELSSP